MGCVVLVLRSLPSCWSCSVAGVFRLAECEAGSVVGSPRGWFCVGTLRVCPVAVAGGELLCEVWFHHIIHCNILLTFASKDFQNG